MSLSPLNPHPLDAERSLPDATRATSLFPVPAGALAPDFPPTGSGEREAGSGEQGAGPKGIAALERDLKRERDRVAVVRHYLRLQQKEGHSPASAAAELQACGVDVSRTTLDRHAKRLAAQGPAALRGGHHRSGRKPKHPLTDQEALCLRGLILARSTLNDRTPANHFALAVEEFRHDAGCRPETRAFIAAELDRAARLRRAPAWPPKWRQQAYPTQQEAAFFRGRKHAGELEQVDRRGMFLVLPDGSRRPLAPHTIWEMDDWSDNEVRRSVDPDTGAEVLTRQTLTTQDVFSAALLGFTQVARARDAYRIEDVADHVADSIRAWGLPDYLRLEMGEIWNGTLFHGFTPDVAGWPQDEAWGGLDPLVQVLNVFKSKGKGAIEASFNLQQAMKAHAGLSIGRVRGEFEAATKALTRSQRTGDIDPRFTPLAQAGDRLQQVCEWFNARPKSRRAFGRDLVVPADLLRGATGRPMPADQWWRLCPVQRQATVRGGHVELLVPHYPAAFRFRVNGEADGVHLDHGYQVLVAFHPGRPEEGCHVFNAELGARNRDGFRRAERILVAPPAADVPQANLSGVGAFSPRRKAAAAVQRSFRAIGQARRSAHAQTSDGRVSRLETGGARPAAPLPDLGRGLALTPPRRGDDVADLAANDPALRDFMDLAGAVPA